MYYVIDDGLNVFKVKKEVMQKCFNDIIAPLDILDQIGNENIGEVLHQIGTGLRAIVSPTKTYKYEDIDSLEDLKDILLDEINERHKDTKFIKMALSYLREVIDELENTNENVLRCNEIIEEVIDFLNDKKCAMRCPMCEESEMYHEEYKGTHIYICEPCPFVGFELIDEQDQKNMIEWLGEK